jgi:hypothetical protein
MKIALQFYPWLSKNIIKNKGTSKNYLIGCSLVGTIYRIKPLFLIAKIRKKAVFKGAHNSFNL